MFGRRDLCSCYIEFCTKIESLTKWPPFFLQTEVFTKRPLLLYSPHQMTPFFSLVRTERPPFFFIKSVTERPLLWGSCPHILVTSICECPPGSEGPLATSLPYYSCLQKVSPAFNAFSMFTFVYIFVTDTVILAQLLIVIDANPYAYSLIFNIKVMVYL